MEPFHVWSWTCYTFDNLLIPQLTSKAESNDDLGCRMIVERVVDADTVIVVVHDDHHFQRNVPAVRTHVRERDGVRAMLNNLPHSGSKFRLAPADDDVRPFAGIGEFQSWLHSRVLRLVHSFIVIGCAVELVQRHLFDGAPVLRIGDIPKENLVAVVVEPAYAFEQLGLTQLIECETR